MEAFWIHGRMWTGERLAALDVGRINSIRGSSIFKGRPVDKGYLSIKAIEAMLSPPRPSVEWKIHQRQAMMMGRIDIRQLYLYSFV